MRQIELRLALVLYGGVSLAVYMHGITREFLSLVQASRRIEARAGRAGRRRGAKRGGTNKESVEAYEAFLEMFRPAMDLRVVVDVIAGASAGGVNGVMLARALAHNLSLDTHRDLWLENADVTRLAGEPVGLTRYLKGSIAPVLNRLVSMALKAELSDPETRLKLHQFMQARWFTPPFSGERYVGWMLDACQSMEARRGGDGAEPATLIPLGQSLDLYVTVTDFHGARRRFPIEDGGAVEEVEHRRILQYGARRRGDGAMESDFTDDAIPDLVFSARATSSFPGAFPPMTVAEMDKVLAARGDPWPRRASFLARAFADCGGSGEGRVLVDGSVVMNKPFQPVLEAIAGRPPPGKSCAGSFMSTRSSRAKKKAPVPPRPRPGRTRRTPGPCRPAPASSASYWPRLRIFRAMNPSGTRSIRLPTTIGRPRAWRRFFPQPNRWSKRRFARSSGATVNGP